MRLTVSDAVLPRTIYHRRSERCARGGIPTLNVMDNSIGNELTLQSSRGVYRWKRGVADSIVMYGIFSPLNAVSPDGGVTPGWRRRIAHCCRLCSREPGQRCDAAGMRQQVAVDGRRSAINVVRSILWPPAARDRPSRRSGRSSYHVHIHAHTVAFQYADCS